VDSVLAQTYGDYELILVDDGSTDGSGALCDRISEECHCRCIHQENGGLGDARNTGIEAAKGEYLVFLDSDDFIAPETLSGLAAEMAKVPADIYSFGFVTSDGERALAPYVDALPYHRLLSLETCPELLLALPNAWCRAVRRELFLTSGIRFPSRVWYEDIRTTMKLFALAEGIVVLPETWYYYVQREGSITRNANVARNREIIDAFEDLLGWYRAQGLFDRYRVQLERLCVDHVFLAASVRVLRVDPRHPLLQEFRQYTKKNFPNYQKNPLLGQLPRSKHLAYTLLEKRQYRLLRLLFQIKDRKEASS
jgi:glycosyltransferase involved in cell wall biosynthesis